MERKRITKQEVIDLINSGVTKDRRSEFFTEEKGTLIEKLQLTSNALKRLFDSSAELRKAYANKFAPTSKVKFDDFILEDEEINVSEAQNTVEDTIQEHIENLNCDTTECNGEVSFEEEKQIVAEVEHKLNW